MRDEGVTKFSCEFERRAIQLDTTAQTLVDCRNRMFNLGLIGVYPDGIGFGNVSQRIGSDGKFIITGTQTGHKPKLSVEDLSLVTSFNLEKNRVQCVGLIAASSESMTHAALYALDTEIEVVIHIHHAQLWREGQAHLPTTRAEVPYGTPAMAHEMARLFAETDVRESKIFIMAGHDEGVVTFGNDFTEVEGVISNYKFNERSR